MRPGWQPLLATKAAEAEATRKVGEAEADALKARGLAEAEAIAKRAEALASNQDAVIGQHLPRSGRRLCVPVPSRSATSTSSWS